MTKDNGLFKKAIGLITYQKKTPKREFKLQESDNNDKDSENNSGTASSMFNKNNDNNDNIYSEINKNEARIFQIFNFPENEDIVVRRFTAIGKYKAFVVYLSGIVDSTIDNSFMLRPLMKKEESENEASCQPDYIINNILETNRTKVIMSYKDVTDEILSGNTGVFIDGCNYFVVCTTRGYEKRAVEKPQSEGIVFMCAIKHKSTYRL